MDKKEYIHEILKGLQDMMERSDGVTFHEKEYPVMYFDSSRNKGLRQRVYTLEIKVTEKV